MAKWVTGQWQETNVSLHHTGHPHKLSSTPGPRSEFLIRLWSGWWGQCLRGETGGVTMSTLHLQSHQFFVFFTFSTSPTQNGQFRLFNNIDQPLCCWVWGYYRENDQLGLEKWLTAGRLWLTSLGEDTALDLLRGPCWYTSLWWRTAGMCVCL